MLQNNRKGVNPVHSGEIEKAGGMTDATPVDLSTTARSGLESAQADGGAARGHVSRAVNMAQLARTGGVAGPFNQASGDISLKGGDVTAGTAALPSGSAPVTPQSQESAPSGSYGSGSAPVATQKPESKPSNSYGSGNPF